MTELLPLNDTSIVTLLGERVIEVLEGRMVDSVVDNTKVGLAREGKLQDDPTVNLTNMLVREGGDEWPDILIPPNYPLYAPQYEMPMGTSWLRRFRVEYILFFQDAVIQRSDARNRANIIFSRFKWLISTIDLSGMTDTFRETAIMTQVNRLESFEEGGPGTFIWRGTHFIEFVTEQVFD